MYAVTLQDLLFVISDHFMVAIVSIEAISSVWLVKIIVINDPLSLCVHMCMHGHPV